MSTAVPCVFCEIAARRIPAAIVAETDRVLAFLDIAPIRPGHVQIVPKTHHRCFDDLPPDLLAEIAALGQRVARAQKRLWGVERVGFFFTGTEIAHAHAHVVPMAASDDVTSRRYIAEQVVTYRMPPRPAPEELAAVARRIAEELREEDG